MNVENPNGFTTVDLGSGCLAGFTNRFGGVSAAPYDSLNLGANVSDSVASVAANRARLATFGQAIVFSTQIHGADVITLDDDEVSAWLVASPPESAGEADGLLTTSKRVGLGVLVADCVPVLLGANGVVATAHAGRRGVEQNVVSIVVEKMRAAGAEHVKAAIGPAICGQCYEVPLDMRAEVVAKEPTAWAETRLGTPGLDLPAAVADQLQRAGAEVAYQSPSCTFEHEEYFSHRRASAGGSGAQPGGKPVLFG